MSPVIELLIKKTQEGKLYWFRDDNRYVTKLETNYGYVHVGLTYINFDGYPIANIDGITNLNKCIYDSIEDRVLNSKLKNENSLIEKLAKL